MNDTDSITISLIVSLLYHKRIDLNAKALLLLMGINHKSALRLQLDSLMYIPRGVDLSLFHRRP